MKNYIDVHFCSNAIIGNYFIILYLGLGPYTRKLVLTFLSRNIMYLCRALLMYNVTCTFEVSHYGYANRFVRKIGIMIKLGIT